MRRVSPTPWWLLWCVLSAAALGAAGCGEKARCTAEVMDDRGKYTGAAEGKKGQARLDRDAMRDACRQKCAAQKDPIPDACAARCLVDIDARKVGARVQCTDR